MTTPWNDPSIEDVPETDEHSHLDHHGHGKHAKHLDEGELVRRTEQERQDLDAGRQS